MLPDMRLDINNELTFKTQVEFKLLNHLVRNLVGILRIFPSQINTNSIFQYY